MSLNWREKILRISGLFSESLFTPDEQIILKRFKKWRRIETEEEQSVIDEYADVGFIEFLTSRVARLNLLGRTAL